MDARLMLAGVALCGLLTCSACSDDGPPTLAFSEAQTGQGVANSTVLDRAEFPFWDVADVSSVLLTTVVVGGAEWTLPDSPDGFVELYIAEERQVRDPARSKAELLDVIAPANVVERVPEAAPYVSEWNSFVKVYFVGNTESSGMVPEIPTWIEQDHY